MQNQIISVSRVSWTWADHISTYRFWGLLIYYLLSLGSFAMFSSFLALYLNNSIGIEISEIGVVNALIALGGIYGFYLAWVTVRWKTVPMLVVAGLIQLAGYILLTVPSLASIPAVRWIGALLLGLGPGIITLAIPSIIAGGRGGGEVFLLTFGLIFILSRINNMFAPIFVGLVYDQFGTWSLGIPVISVLLIGLVFLLPVNRSLFREPPGERGYPLSPARHEPVLEAFLCLIPFYWLYWIYRAHGEVTALAPSRRILSPLGSVLACLFIPYVIYPVVLTTLNDALNDNAAQIGRQPYRASWVICLWAILFFPVAIGLLQSTMNQIMAEIDRGYKPNRPDPGWS